MRGISANQVVFRLAKEGMHFILKNITFLENKCSKLGLNLKFYEKVKKMLLL